MTPNDDLSTLRQTPFCDAVAKLEELMTQGSRAFLLGAGCSKCAGFPLTSELTSKALESDLLEVATKAILGALVKEFAGAEDANIEDYLSELIDLLAIAERRHSRGASRTKTEFGGKEYKPEELRAAVENVKAAIAGLFHCKITIETHQRFVRAVHRPLRPGKPIADYLVEYLVINYDTLIEDALALERIAYSDGLAGGTTGWWHPTAFDRDGIKARVLKMHGSIDWCDLPDDPLPRRIARNLIGQAMTDKRILIWPASTKYRETQLDPYAQLAERARIALRPAPRSQRVLVVCGYRFGDSHINLEVDQALRASDGRLTIAVFTSDEQPSGQIRAWIEDPVVHEQVLVFAKRGFFHGEQAELSPADLPWWKFESLTRLLEGER